MAFKEQVLDLVNQALLQNESLFLIDITISETNKIEVLIDGDNGVNLQDCIDLSRFIENNLDREENDFSLEVASVGIGTPLKLTRQYKKNIGRDLIVTTKDTKIEAELIAATEESITLSWSAREPKKIGKGKETVLKKEEILYKDITKAIVTVKF
jgi:ribosome maturation factor RimP